MTVASAVKIFLDEAKSDDDFNLNLKIDWLEEKVSDVIAEWAVENGYEFDEDICEWVRIP